MDPKLQNTEIITMNETPSNKIIQQKNNAATYYEQHFTQNQINDTTLVPSHLGKEARCGCPTTQKADSLTNDIRNTLLTLSSREEYLANTLEKH
jgi:hypothetical protein